MPENQPPHSTGRATARRVARRDTNPIPTIGDVLLKEVRELKTMLTFLRDEEPDSFLGSFGKLGILQDLSEGQQRRLSTLVGKFYAQGDIVKWLAPQRRQRRAWAKDGRRRLRMLKKEIVEARRAIKAVRVRLEQVGVRAGRRVDDVLDRAVAVLDPASLHEVEAVVSSLETTEPSERATSALYDFFVLECGLAKNEAEVRVGKIGNYFWDWHVEVIERSSSRDEKWKGCEAVRKAIARHRKHSTDTPTKNH